MVALNELAYTIQPRPQVGKVDLAGAFFNTNRFKEAKVLFCKFHFLILFIFDKTI